MTTFRTSTHDYTIVSIIISVLLIFFLVTPARTYASTITVDTLLDENDGSCSDGDCSLRDAIQVASAGDTISFSVTGTIVLTMGHLTIDKDMTISGPGPESLTIDGNHTTRIFYVTGENTAFSGLIIANASGYNGAGMYNYYGTTTLTDVIFSDNTAYHGGGGIFNEYGNALLTNVTFSGNSDAISGGGMYNKEGIATLMNVTFNDNSDTTYGGGMYNTKGTATLTNVTFSGNSAGGGGGMYNDHGTATLMNVIFSGNSANSGGGLGNYNYSHATLTNVTFSGNSATSYGGGGMENGGYSTSTLTNITFNDNSAIYYGGGMENTWSTSTLTNVTFSGNSAIHFGGGVYMENNYDVWNCTLTNVTISGNSAAYGGGVYIANTGSSNGIHYSSYLNLKNTLLAGNTAPSGPDCYGTLTSYGYNLIQDTTGCTVAGDQTGNIYAKNPLLGPLVDNGGYTLTHALLPGSPAIDAANFTDPYGNPVTDDQRGVTRPQGSANDIGAFELVYQVHWVWFPFVLK